MSFWGTSTQLGHFNASALLKQTHGTPSQPSQEALRVLAVVGYALHLSWSISGLSPCFQVAALGHLQRCAPHGWC